MRSSSRAVRLAIGTAGVVAALLGAVSAPANAEASGPELCFRGHVQDVGWQNWDCDTDGSRAFAGTVGQTRRLEALQVIARNTTGVTCVRAHVQDLGWGDQLCVADSFIAQVGTTGEKKQIEALSFGNSARTLCANAHVQDVGWTGNTCAQPGKDIVVGTTGRGLRLEAVDGTVQ